MEKPLRRTAVIFAAIALPLGFAASASADTSIARLATMGATATSSFTFDSGVTGTTATASGTPNSTNSSTQNVTAWDDLYTPTIPTTQPWRLTGVNTGNSHVFTVHLNTALSEVDWHALNLDGSKVSVSGTSTTGDPLVVTRLSGNSLFDVVGNSINDTTQVPNTLGCRPSSGSGTSNGACGSVRISAASGLVQDITFTNTNVAGSDGWGWTLTYPGPTANDDEVTTSTGTPVTFNPTNNDTAAGSALDPTSVRLIDNGTPVTSLSTADGDYTVNTSTGAITFTPASGFEGTASPVSYQVSDTTGASASASIAVAVAPTVGTPAVNLPVAGGMAVLAAAMAGLWLAIRRRTRSSLV